MRARLFAFAIALWGAATLAAGSAHAQQEEIAECDKAFEEDDLDKAAKKCDDAIRSNPALMPPEIYAKRAAIFFLQRKNEAGLRFIDEVALPRHPGDPSVLEQKALMLWSLNRKQDAVDIADDVAKQKPSAFQVQLIRGEYYFRRDPVKAGDAYKHYLQHRTSDLSSEDALPRLRLGLMSLQTGNYEQAQRQFEIVSKQFRSNNMWQVNAQNGLCAAYTGGEEYDRAITLCERIIENPKHIDRKGSVWLNLGLAYLNNKQPRKARQAGIEFTRIQRGNPKGYMLIGEAYYEERNWEEALRYYIEAEKRSQQDKKILLKLGQIYRRLNKPNLALPRLEQAYAQRPDAEIAAELGEVYLHEDVRQDVKALSAVDKLLEKRPNDDQLLYIAGRSLYNQGKLPQAKARFLQAHNERKQETKYLRGLIETINKQAHDAFINDDVSAAEKHLIDAYGYNQSSAITNRNLAVIQLEQGECDGALKYLAHLRKQRREETLANRLMARAYLCKNSPEPAKAIKLYEAAAKGSTRNKLLLAEIYAEMAPLLMQKNLDEAIDRLETANQYAGTNSDVGPAIQRNLALALFQRGWRNMKARGKTDEAVADFERATRNPALLKGSERPAFEFSLALAYLDKGNTAEAKKLFDELRKSKQEDYLKPPYDKIGPVLFSAYAEYRTSNLRSRREAATTFEKILRGARGSFKNMLDDLTRSAWELVAWEEFQAGRGSAAKSALASARRFGNSASLTHNLAVASGGSVSDFDKMNASPPEALVNLGIAYDRAGKAKEAHDAWVQARARGVRHPKLDDWIGAKKRIFGF